MLAKVHSHGGCMTGWPSVNVAPRMSMRERRGPLPHEHTEEERNALGELRRKRRARKTAQGKHTYQPRPSV